MESTDQSSEKILIRDEKGPNLPVTPCLVGQEFCAYTYSLVREVKSPIYGAFKVLCFGRTMKEVEHTVAEMIRTGKIEKEVGFISIRRTGYYDYLVQGGSEKKHVEAVRTQTGELVREVFDAQNERKKAEMREMEERMKTVQEESLSDSKPAIPDDYQQYKFYRAQGMMADQRLKQIEAEAEHIRKVKAKGQKEVQRLVRQHGNFPKRFESEVEGNKQAHLAKMEQLAANNEETNDLASSQVIPSGDSGPDLKVTSSSE